MPSDRGAAIREAAVKLFAEKGYDATSMRDIAKAVGLLPGSLYAHIDSKESLLLEVIETGVDEFLKAVRAAEAESSDPVDQLRGSIRAHLEVLGKNRDRTGVVFHQWRALAGADRTRVQQKRHAYQEHFVALLDRGVEQGVFAPDLDTGLTVLLLLGALNWASEWFTPGGRGTVAELADNVTDLLLQGITPA